MNVHIRSLAYIQTVHQSDRQDTQVDRQTYRHSDTLRDRQKKVFSLFSFPQCQVLTKTVRSADSSRQMEGQTIAVDRCLT